jgi:GntR family transcriptional regulator/MocR family aminotransferase
MEHVFDLPLHLPGRDSRRLLQSLHAQLRTAILDGRLKPGLRLPPTRILAARYGIGRNTAIAAYDLLLGEGHIVSRRGAGTYVAGVRARAKPRKPAESNPRAESINPFWKNAAPTSTRWPQPPRFDFGAGIPDVGSFPLAIWRKLYARTLRTLRERARYGDSHGQSALRAAIAGHVSFARAVACTAEDVLVTSGAQQAFDLISRVLVTRKQTRVAVEDPGHLPVRAAFAAAGAHIVPVPVDDEGIRVDRIPAKVRVVCVSPSHQFPSGCTMSMARRAALIDFAARQGAVIIEDDYDGEFRFSEHATDALQTLDRSESVFYVGTFSKSLFPGLRLGFTIAPAWAMEPLAAVRQSTDWHSDVDRQDVLAAFISEGHLARHMRRMRGVYGARRELLLNELRQTFADRLDIVPSTAGLHLCARARLGYDTEALVERARQNGLRIESLRRFQIERRARPGLIFGYGAIDAAQIPKGLSLLQRLWSA